MPNRTATRRFSPATIGAVGMLAVSLAAIAGMLTLDAVAGGGIADDAAMMIAVGTFGVVGVAIVLRRPRQTIGWLFCVTAMVAPMGELGNRFAEYTVRSGRTLPTIAEVWLWFGQWYWVLAFGSAIVLVPLLYPTGRPPSRRWWSVVWLSVVLLGAVGVLFAVQPEIVVDWLGPEIAVANLLGVAGAPDPDGYPVLGLLVLLLPISAFGSMVVRFRSSGAQERLQIKWLVYAFGFLVAWIVLDALVLGVPSSFPMGLVLSGIPVCTGIAITRYRLYEIDRIINRTIVYAAVVALLGGVFAGGVALTATVLPTASGSLGAAASTLAAAALFSPLRRRVQRMVDRRFNRLAYDPQRVADQLSTSLRGMVEPDAVSARWAEAVNSALQPATAEVWVGDMR